jgi:hypothetical protein
MSDESLQPEVKRLLHNHLKLYAHLRDNIGAGVAFMRAVENDPDAQAALKRAQARLRAFAEALKDPEVQRELERSRREQEQAFQALTDAMRESARAAQQDLGDLGDMGSGPPKTLEDWEYLARVVEMPFETIQAGNFTAHDVYLMALAWEDRQRMKARFGGGDEAESIKTTGDVCGEDALTTAPKPKRGRTGMTDEERKRDEKIHKEYHRGGYATYDEAEAGMSRLERWRDITADEIRKAVDRHRKRLERRTQSDRKPVK